MTSVPEIKTMAAQDMDEIKACIRSVAVEVAATVQTTKMEETAKVHMHATIKDILGVDTSVVSDVRDLRANMNFIRAFRKSSEKVGMTIILTIASILTFGIATAIWRSLGR